MKSLHPALRTLVLTVVFLGALGLLLAYDGARQRSQVPDQLRYLPATAAGILYVPSLEDARDRLKPHLAHSNPVVDPVSAMLKSLDRMSSTNPCLYPRSRDNLEEIGLNPAGILAVAFADIEIRVRAMTLPMEDTEAFLPYLRDRMLGSGYVWLYTEDSERNPTEIRVRRIGDVDYGRLCLGRELVGETPAKISDRDAFLSFAPDWERRGALQIACTVLYEDGSEGPCVCEFNPEVFDATSEATECTRAVEVLSGEDAISGFRPRLIDLGSRRVLGIDALPLVFPQPGLALFASDRATLETALQDTDANLENHMGSAGVFAPLSGHDEASGGAESLLVGGMRLPGTLGAGNLSYVVSADEERLRVDLSADVPSFGVRFLSRIMEERAPGAAAAVVALDPSQAAVLLNDTHVSYYLAFFLDNVSGFRDRTEEVLGNFSVMLRELGTLGTVDGIGLHLVGLRSGIPELLLAIHFSESDPNAYSGETVADALVDRVQRKLRQERDLEILVAAKSRYEEENDGYASDIEQLDELLLTVEPEPTLHHYRVEDGEVVAPETGLPQELFAGARYCRVEASGVLRYLLPPVTGLDLEYRFADEDFDEQDRSQLTNDRNRLCAAYVPQASLLLVGTDADTLRPLLAEARYARENALYQRLAAAGRDRSPSKLSLFLRPDWLVGQGRAHASDDVRSLATDFAELEPYEGLLFTVSPREDRDGFDAALELHQR